MKFSSKLHIDTVYVPQLCSRFRNYKKTRDYVWNFSCPICGDSEKKKNKARGYIYRKEDTLLYRCHNCNAGMTFSTFLKSQDPILYNHYVLEAFGGVRDTTQEQEFTAKDLGSTPPVFMEPHEALRDLARVSELPEDHFCKKYVVGRKIPEKLHSLLYYCDDFQPLAAKLNSSKAQKIPSGEQRLIIPFFDENKKLIGLQGRALDNNKLRYVTLKVSDESPKVFGLDRFDKTKTGFIVEGPIDSLFLPNCLAAAGSSTDLFEYVDKKNCIVVMDNEPRNKEIVSVMKKCADAGFRVCIWPTTNNHKDINDMVLSGMSQEDIVAQIMNNSFSGLNFDLNLASWKRC